MNKEILKAIEELADRATLSNFQPHEAMQLTQAVLNLAHAHAVIVNTESLQKS
jgi:hypothetical protein